MFRGIRKSRFQTSKYIEYLSNTHMNAVVISILLVLFIFFLILYFVFGIDENGHLLSVSNVVNRNKPLGNLILSSINLFLFLCLFPEYEPFSWLHWVLGQYIVSYNTDQNDLIYMFLLCVLSAIDLLVIINLSINHDMFFFAIPFFLVILVFLIFIIFNLLAYGVFFYHGSSSEHPLMQTIQSVLEISFLFAIFFFLSCYYYLHLLPLEPLCKFPV